jgi:hypothetical protein
MRARHGDIPTSSTTSTGASRSTSRNWYPPSTLRSPLARDEEDDAGAEEAAAAGSATSRVRSTGSKRRVMTIAWMRTSIVLCGAR